MKQEYAPLWEALGEYKTKGIIPFHTPGHKLKSGPFINIANVVGEGFFSLDPSDEIEDVEINHDFEVALAKAENLAAQLFGSQDSLFLVNGTTGGLHYLLMPVTGRVLIPRFSHQAVYSALMLAEGEAAYLETTYDAEWLIPLPPEPKRVEEELSTGNYQALLLTHPTYYGSITDLDRIIKTAKKRNVLVFIDEAHGGHFHFSKEFPLPALDCGADCVVQSTHKTLGSFTQTSMLHSNNRQWFEKVKQCHQVLQTTSPSLVFLAALDEVRRVLALEGRRLMEQTLELAHFCREQLGQFPGVQILPNRLTADPTKVVFTLRDLGLTGIEVEAILRKQYNIQVELSDYYNVLALITLGDTWETVNRLVKAVKDLSSRRRHLAHARLPRHNLDLPDFPKSVYPLRESFFLDKEQISLEHALGRVSGAFLTPYPPGVPVIVPGELFTKEIVDHIRWCQGLGWPIRGLAQKEKVTVLKDYSGFCRKIR